MSTRGPRYGTPPTPRLIAFEINRKGLASCIVRTPFIERPNDPLAVDFGAEPRMPGMGLVTAGLREKSDGPGFEVEWHYEGGVESNGNGNGSGVGGGGSGGNVPTTSIESVYREFLPANTERPIITNPNWPAIKKKYGADDEGNFPPDLPSVTGRGGAPVPSSLYGAKTYKVAYGIFQVTTITTAARSSVLEGINTIFANPPGLSIIGLTTPKGFNWLKLAPRIAARGSVFQFIEQWDLGQYNPDLYRKAAFA